MLRPGEVDAARRPSWSASRPQSGIVTVEASRKAEKVQE